MCSHDAFRVSHLWCLTMSVLTFRLSQQVRLWCLTMSMLTFRLSQQVYGFGFCIAPPLVPFPDHRYWISACPALISALEFQGVKQDPPSKGCTLQWGLEESDDKHTDKTIEAGGSKRGNGIENHLGEGWVLRYSWYWGVVCQYWNADYISDIKMLEIWWY